MIVGINRLPGLSLILFCLFVFVHPALSYLKWNYGLLQNIPFTAIMLGFSLFILLEAALHSVATVTGTIKSVPFIIFLYGILVAAVGSIDLYFKSIDLFVILSTFSSTVLAIICLLPFCLYYPHITRTLQKKGMVTVVLWTLPLIMVVAHGALKGKEAYGKYALYQTPGAPLTYLAMSDAFAIFGMMALTCMKSKWKYAIISLSFMGIFLTYSRASLYFYVVSIVIYLFYKVRASRLFLAFAFLTLISSIYVMFQGVDPNGRFTKLLTDPYSDPSFKGRIDYLIEGIELIGENWLFGSYGAEIVRDGATGGYIHNVLSYWAAYGVIYFIFLLLVIIFVYIKSGFYIIKTRSADLDLAFIIFIYAVLCSIFAKSYVWPFLWFSIFNITFFFINRPDKRGNFDHTTTL